MRNKNNSGICSFCHRLFSVDRAWFTFSYPTRSYKHDLAFVISRLTRRAWKKIEAPAQTFAVLSSWQMLAWDWSLAELCLGPCRSHTGSGAFEARPGARPGTGRTVSVSLLCVYAACPIRAGHYGFVFDQTLAHTDRIVEFRHAWGDRINRYMCVSHH